MIRHMDRLKKIIIEIRLSKSIPSFEFNGCLKMEIPFLYFSFLYFFHSTWFWIYPLISLPMSNLIEDPPESRPR